MIRPNYPYGNCTVTKEPESALQGGSSEILIWCTLRASRFVVVCTCLMAHGVIAVKNDKSVSSKPTARDPTSRHLCGQHFIFGVSRKPLGNSIRDHGDTQRESICWCFANHLRRLCENLHVDIADTVAGKITPAVDHVVQNAFLCLLPPNMPANKPWRLVPSQAHKQLSSQLKTTPSSDIMEMALAANRGHARPALNIAESLLR